MIHGIVTNKNMKNLNSGADMATAVLIIDVQQGLCEGPEAVFDAAGTIERINRVNSHARGKGALVVFIRHESQSGLLTHGSAAWQLARGLVTKPSDQFIRKTTPDSFLGTGLEALLQQHKIKDLVICGMMTEFCVDTTTRRALALGFPVTLVSDGHTSAGNSALSPQQVIAHHNETLSNMASFGPRVKPVPSDRIEIDS